MTSDWQSVDRDEYPGESMIVWTTDQANVRLGIFTHGGPGVPLVEGAWEDLEDKSIAVTHWMFLEDSRTSGPDLGKLRR